MKTRPKTRSREERLLPVTFERRADGENPLRIMGHPVVYNRWSEDLGGFRERVMHGAATRTIANSDIRVLFNHDPNIVMGRNTAGTAVFRDQASGLAMECYPPDTMLLRDMVLTPMERGDINQMSFAFRAIQDEWRSPDDPAIVNKDGLWERDIREFQMFDASIVTFPAYTQTDASIRMGLGALAGLDLPALAALLTRAERGLPFLDADLDLLNGSISALRSYLPLDSEPDEGHHSGADSEPDEGHHSAGRSVEHLRRLLDMRNRHVALA